MFIYQHILDNTTALDLIYGTVYCVVADSEYANHYAIYTLSKPLLLKGQYTVLAMS